jgi:adenosylhomocysteine nucleosidase
VRWGAVTGLAAEARILERRSIPAIATSGDETAIWAATARLIAAGVDGLLSFGVAGALAPGLAPGTLLLPARILDETRRAWPTDAHLFSSRTTVLQTGDLLGCAAPVATVEEKAALHRRTGAVAVDLESHVVAAAALRANLPFLVLRAVADPADADLPPAALVGLDAAGRTALRPVLASLARDPGQLWRLVALARDTRRALLALERASAAL